MPTLKRFMLLAAMLAAAVQAQAQARSTIELATELTALTELDRAALFGTRMAIDHAVQLGHLDPSIGSCFAGKSHQPLTAPIARYLARQLTKQELQAAVDFYGSPVGRKLVQRDGQAFLDALTPGAQPQPAAALSKEEQAQVDAFLRTGAGLKLVKRNVMRTADRDPGIAKVLAQMRESCVHT